MSTSTLSSLLPLLILTLVLGFAAFVGYACYTIANDVAGKASKSMEKRHLSVSKDGMVVGVREKNVENYVDQTQSLFVKAWNFSRWPAYKSRFWNKDVDTPQPQARHSYSRSSLSGSSKSK